MLHPPVTVPHRSNLFIVANSLYNCYNVSLPPAHKHTHERTRPRHRQTYRCTGASVVWVPHGFAWSSFPEAVATYTLRSLWWASTLAVRPRSMIRCTTEHHVRWGHWELRELCPHLTWHRKAYNDRCVVPISLDRWRAWSAYRGVCVYRSAMAQCIDFLLDND